MKCPCGSAFGEPAAPAAARFSPSKQHHLYCLPLPQGQGSYFPKLRMGVIISAFERAAQAILCRRSRLVRISAGTRLLAGCWDEQATERCWQIFAGGDCRTDFALPLRRPVVGRVRPPGKNFSRAIALLDLRSDRPRGWPWLQAGDWPADVSRGEAGETSGRSRGVGGRGQPARRGVGAL